MYKMKDETLHHIIQMKREIWQFCPQRGISFRELLLKWNITHFWPNILLYYDIKRGSHLGNTVCGQKLFIKIVQRNLKFTYYNDTLSRK